jgi:alpha-glucosidase
MVRTCLLTLVLVSGAAGWASAGDGQVNRAALFADQSRLFLHPTEPESGDAVVARLWSAPDDLTAAAVMVRAGDAVQVYPMGLMRRGAVDVWEGQFTLGDETVDYWFRATDGADTVYLNAFEVSTSPPTRLNFWLVPGFHTPDWAKGIAWYQIFPDRFADGDPANNVYTGEYDYYGPVQARDWGTLPNPDQASREFFGGDLNGVRAELGPYLQEVLGVRALYLNPVFRSPSNHKYDTMDYLDVDGHFGGDDALSALIAAAHADADFGGDYPVRVMLDGVFNHCGDWHYWFDRAHRWDPAGAYESQSSAWSDYFTFAAWPDDYVTFGVSFGGHFDSMPKLDYASAALRDEIYSAAGSIARVWLRPPFSIDGWRLDVGQEVGEDGQVVHDGSNTVGKNNHAVWADFRDAVKAENPDALILGEFWGYPTRWLMGGEWDSVMNYNGFTTPMGAWLLKTDLWGDPWEIATTDLDDWLQGTLADNPWPVRLAMMNSWSTHDIVRLYRRAAGDADLLQAAAVVQMTYPGAPCIYYGDEVGLDGGRDPDCRRTFPWDELAEPGRAEQLELHARLLQLRAESGALRVGSYAGLLADQATGTFAFARFDANGDIISVIRRRGTTTAAVTVPVGRIGVPDGARFRDLTTGVEYTAADGKLNLGPVPGEGWRVLVRTAFAAAWTEFAVEPMRQTALTLASADGAVHAGWAEIRLDDPEDRARLQAALSFRYATGAATATETILFPAPRVTRFQALVNHAVGELTSGVAVTNPGAEPVHLDLRLTTQAGGVFSASLDLLPGRSYPRFLDGLFSGLPDEITGILEVVADGPVAPMQLSIRTNERSEFLLSALPVMALDASDPGDTVVLNYFAVGAGYTTEIRLAAPGATGTVTGQIHFFDENGQPLDVAIQPNPPTVLP